MNTNKVLKNILGDRSKNRLTTGQGGLYDKYRYWVNQGRRRKFLSSMGIRGKDLDDTMKKRVVYNDDTMFDTINPEHFDKDIWCKCGNPSGKSYPKKSSTSLNIPHTTCADCGKVTYIGNLGDL